MTINNRRRSAFTLVEMLVAAALIIFMMYIIASTFESGLSSFRTLKAQGDLQDKLRAAATAIRLDLTSQHFGDGSALSDQLLNNQIWQPSAKGYFRISQPGPTGTLEGVDPDNPSARYYLLTPTAAQNLYLQFTVNLTNSHPSVRDARARQDQFFSTTTSPDVTLNQFSAPDYNFIPSGSTSFTSYWAEVTYLAKLQSPLKFTDATQTVPLYNLYRRQTLLVDSPTTNVAPPFPNGMGNSLKDVSVSNLASQLLLLNRPADVTEPVRRWGMLPAALNSNNPPPKYGQTVPAQSMNGLAIFPPFQNLYEEAVANLPPVGANAASVYADQQLGPRIGGDLLLTNVINFDIKVLWEPVVYGPNTVRFFNILPNGTPVPVCPADTTPPQQMTGGIANPDYPFDYLPFGINPGFTASSSMAPNNPARVFDTWSSNTDSSVNPPYIYGVDRTIYPATGPLASPQPGLATDPNYANWNIGHFMPVAGVPAANTQASTPTGYTIPLRVRVRALQIKLRIWDPKTSQTRQMTIIQDM